MLPTRRRTSLANGGIMRLHQEAEFERIQSHSAHLQDSDDLFGGVGVDDGYDEPVDDEEVFNEISESLVATQVEKFKKLTEGVEYDDLSNYKKKLQIIKENYFGTAKAEKRTSGLLEESFEGEEEMPVTRGPMAHYMKAISRNTVK